MSALQADTVNDELERCREWLEAAMARGAHTHEWEDIINGVLDGRYHFWSSDDAALLTEFVYYPRAQYVHVFLAGGNLDKIMDMRDSVERFAQGYGFDGVSMTGRRGWVRALGDHGYDEGLTVVTKTFEEVV